MINIPKYRLDEIIKIYDVFNKKNIKNIDLKDRKIQLKKIIKTYYKWITDDEYKYIYSLLKERELNSIVDIKKIEIENGYKNELIKLFGKFDVNNSNTIDLEEFRNIFVKLEVDTNLDLEKIFREADKNGDNELTIDEFIIFMAKNKDVLEKLDAVIKIKRDLRYKNDKRTLLFNNFPGSPLKGNWRPSLSNLKNLDKIKDNVNY